VHGLNTNFLFPRGVSSVRGSRWANCFLQGADRTPIKSGMGKGHTGNYSKRRDGTGYQINLLSAAKGLNNFS
jgi:hypothetical protein